MKKFSFIVLALFIASLSVGLVAAQDPVEIRFMWYSDGNEGEVMQELLDRFEADNPDIDVVLDVVAYTSILEQLPIQVEAGEGPDMARITQIPSLAGNYLDIRPYLTDADAYEAAFPSFVLEAMRTGDDDNGIYGYPDQFTVTGPYINRTLFEQAGVDVPSDSSDAVSWEEWTDACAAVAEATGTDYAIAMDRSGHRFAGPAISQGATLFDEEGNVTIDSEGFRSMADILAGWHTAGITPAEVWLGAGGSYSPANDYFINGQLVCQMAGSWLVGRFTADIGDAFDWEAVPNPTGPGGSTGMPGGAAVVAFASSEHPEEVARVMEYLTSEDVQREYAERTLFIPGDLRLSDLNYQTDSEAALAALNTFVAEVPKFAADAYTLNFHPQNTVIFNAIRDRLTQAMTGELTLDEAIERIQTEADEAVAAAGA